MKTLKELNREERLRLMEDAFEQSVIKRGLEYAREGAVVSIKYLNPDYIFGQVQGSELYETEVAYLDGELYAKCSCPYGDFCKHAVALIMHEFEARAKKQKRPSDIKSFMKAILKELTTTGYLEFDMDEWKQLIKNTEKQTIWKELIAFCKTLDELNETGEIPFYEDYTPYVDDLIVEFFDALENGERGRFFVEVYTAFGLSVLIRSYARFFEKFEDKDVYELRQATIQNKFMAEEPFIETFLRHSQSVPP